jgi:Shugoshin C terminus
LRSSQRIFKEVSRLKEQLESKLSEVGDLVTELGALPEKAKRRSSQHQRRRAGLVELTKSPDQKDWKNRQTIGRVVGGERQLQEGRLPVIVEGKHYPRKTLESLEISRLIEDDDAAASESPELGPPPVAHFDVAEPIDFAPAPALPRVDALTADSYQGHEDDIKPLPDNLERRRRRRASALLEDMPTLNTSSTSTEVSKQVANGMPLKSGAKRKLDVREDRDREDPRPMELDDFAFRRRESGSETPQGRPRGSRFTKVATALTASAAAKKDTNMKLEFGSRKVLAPKSTNSPSKVRRTTGNDKLAPRGDDIAENAKPREELELRKLKPSTNVSSANPRPNQAEDSVVLSKSDGTDLPPKTPAGIDLFSPVSTEPSARTEQPTEMALSASVEDVLGGTDCRASRRARGAVSYAEPSLRAKMRRPTKELVPAVIEQANGFKAQRESSARAESQERQGSEDFAIAKMRTITIKREKFNDENTAWNGPPDAKEDPTSPLVNKVAKSSSRQSPPGEESIAVDPPENNTDVQQIEGALQNLSVSDGPESSPHDSPDTVIVESRKTSRRHSSNPATSSDRLSSKNHSIGVTDRPPRPSSAASLRRENLGRDEKADLKRSASVSNLKPSVGTSSAIASSVAGGSATGRTERAAARRRSMMV